MTKQDIFDKYARDGYSGDAAVLGDDDFDKAADEWAMNQSIDFANWMYHRDEQTASRENEWIGRDMVRRTSAELFQLYLNYKK